MVACLMRVNKETLDLFREDSSEIGNWIYSEEALSDGSELIDIDKSWEAIMYLLSPEDRHAGPLSKVIFSGKLLDEEMDMGYGPAHYHSVEEVAAFHEKLSQIDTEHLLARFDADRMNAEGIYPTWSGGEEDREYIAENFTEVKRLYAEAAANSQAIVSYLS